MICFDNKMDGRARRREREGEIESEEGGSPQHKPTRANDIGRVGGTERFADPRVCVFFFWVRDDFKGREREKEEGAGGLGVVGVTKSPVLCCCISRLPVCKGPSASQPIPCVIKVRAVLLQGHYFHPLKHQRVVGRVEIPSKSQLFMKCFRIPSPPFFFFLPLTASFLANLSAAAHDI